MRLTVGRGTIDGGLVLVDRETGEPVCVLTEPLALKLALEILTDLAERSKARGCS